MRHSILCFLGALFFTVGLQAAPVGVGISSDTEKKFLSFSELSRLIQNPHIVTPKTLQKLHTHITQLTAILVAERVKILQVEMKGRITKNRHIASYFTDIAIHHSDDLLPILLNPIEEKKSFSNELFSILEQAGSEANLAFSRKPKPQDAQLNGYTQTEKESILSSWDVLSRLHWTLSKEAKELRTRTFDAVSLAVSPRFTFEHFHSPKPGTTDPIITSTGSKELDLLFLQSEEEYASPQQYELEVNRYKDMYQNKVRLYKLRKPLIEKIFSKITDGIESMKRIHAGTELDFAMILLLKTVEELEPLLKSENDITADLHLLATTTKERVKNNIAYCKAGVVPFFQLDESPLNNGIQMIANLYFDDFGFRNKSILEYIRPAHVRKKIFCFLSCRLVHPAKHVY